MARGRGTHVYFRLLVTVALGFGIANAPALAARRYSQWSTPTALDAVNTVALEFANGISKDGLSFYFQRGTAAVSGEDIWVVHREHKRAPWGTPQKLPQTVNSDANDRAAFVSADGHSGSIPVRHSSTMKVTATTTATMKVRAEPAAPTFTSSATRRARRTTRSTST